jgi:hypothetical protein
VSDDGTDSVFTAEYVKQLRDENATWRKKVRELEVQTTTDQVSLEFARRGVQADPSWLRIPDGSSVAEAVDQFLVQYPNLAPPGGEPDPDPPQRTPVPAPLPAQQRNANTPGPPARGLLSQRTLEEIKKDPVARKQLVETYRAQLAASSNQQDPGY